MCMHWSHIPYQTFRSYRKATECTFGKNQYATPDTIRKTATLSKKLQTKSGARCLPETYSEKIGRTQFLEMHTIPEKAVHMRPGTRKPLREIQVDPTTGRPWTQHEILRVFNNCPPRQPSHFCRSKKYRTIVRHDLRSTSAIQIRNKQEIQIDTPWNPLATFFGRARNALEIAMSPMDN